MAEVATSCCQTQDHAKPLILSRQEQRHLSDLAVRQSGRSSPSVRRHWCCLFCHSKLRREPSTRFLFCCTRSQSPLLPVPPIAVLPGRHLTCRLLFTALQTPPPCPTTTISCRTLIRRSEKPAQPQTTITRNVDVRAATTLSTRMKTKTRAATSISRTSTTMPSR
jgi:hypothetical protein